MDRVQKRALVEDLSGVLSQQSLLVLTRQTGLTVTESDVLRKRAREEGAAFRVVKNTLLKLAFRQSGASALEEHLGGAVGLSYSKDPLAAARVTVSFAKTYDKFEVIAGFLDGCFLDAEAVRGLASLPSLDVLRGKLVGLVAAPLQALVRTFAAPAAQIVRLSHAYGHKG